MSETSDLFRPLRRVVKKLGYKTSGSEAIEQSYRAAKKKFNAPETQTRDTASDVQPPLVEASAAQTAESDVLSTEESAVLHDLDALAEDTPITDEQKQASLNRIIAYFKDKPLPLIGEYVNRRKDGLTTQEATGITATDADVPNQ